MKAALIGNGHLRSYEIGGDWQNESTRLFTRRILPELSDVEPDVTIFLGDIYYVSSGEADVKEEYVNEFVASLKTFDLAKNAYILKGNQDKVEVLKRIEELGGPKFADEGWIISDDSTFYFFHSRYDNRKAIEDLERIQEQDFGNLKKYLLVHENPEVIQWISKNIYQKYDAVFNGHFHHYSQRKNIFNIGPALPLRPERDFWDVKLTWPADKEEPMIEESGPNYGFYLVNTVAAIDSPDFIKFKPVDIRKKLTIVEIYSDNFSTSEIDVRVRKVHDLLKKIYSPKDTIVRVYLEGNLKKGEEKRNLNLEELKELYSDFYEGRRDLFRTDGLVSAGYERLGFRSREEALEEVEEVHGKEMRRFIEDLIPILDRATFPRDRALEILRRNKEYWLK
ncbi:MAG: hypothetical protein QMD14_02415 [Candidatus Aenigmarchaeota archaeon]|nr:hypothetical protein [Candidatus Aenigmarchaeota archaeon]